jgi:hypothetical protein
LAGRDQLQDGRIAHGKIVGMRAFGSYDDGHAVSTDAIYNVTSLTKPITAPAYHHRRYLVLVHSCHESGDDGVFCRFQCR